MQGNSVMYVIPHTDTFPSLICNVRQNTQNTFQHSFTLLGKDHPNQSGIVLSRTTSFMRVKKNVFILYYVTVLYLLCVPCLVVHLHNCCSSDIQISGCPITQMIALNDRILCWKQYPKAIVMYFVLFWVSSSSSRAGSSILFAMVSICIPAKQQLIPKAKESLIGFSAWLCGCMKYVS